MNLAPSGIGAEPKKLAILIGLLAVAAGTYYWMSRPDIPAGANTGPAPTATAAKTPTAPPPSSSLNSPAGSSSYSASRTTTSAYGPRTSGRGRTSASGDDFRPTLKVPEGMDLSRVDPTLKLDLLAKVRNVSVEGGSRSLFEFYTPPPPPPPPPPKVNPINPDSAKLAAAKEAQKGPAQPAPPPLIPLKFYGYSGALRSTVRRAFFLDGEDIVQAGENETIRNRYKIIRIGVNSAVVEDLIAKNQQTLPLAEEAQ
jgi:hypothetical protein